jgi:hypothetical protein
MDGLRQIDDRQIYDRSRRPSPEFRSIAPQEGQYATAPCSAAPQDGRLGLGVPDCAAFLAYNACLSIWKQYKLETRRLSTHYSHKAYAVPISFRTLDRL